MADLAGTVFGSFVVMFLLSRVSLWLFGSLGDSAARVLVAHAVALTIATIVAGFGLADGGVPRLSTAFGTYSLPTAVWAVFDLVRLWRRQGARA